MSERFRLVEIAGDQVQLGLEDSEQPSQRPITVDFESEKMRFRTKNGADSELVVKSLGLKPSERASVVIVDATCGLATDAFLLATAGFTVIAVEKNLSVFKLVEDGLRRLRLSEAQRGDRPLALSVVHSESVAFLHTLSDRPYAIYLDPMFEESSTRSKSKPKKEMALLRNFLQPDVDAEAIELIKVALTKATSRVVVKRPVRSNPLLSQPLPKHRLQGKVAAFDIYSCRTASHQER